MSFLDRYKDNKELFESLIPIILNFPPWRFLIFRSRTAVFFVLIWAGLDVYKYEFRAERWRDSACEGKELKEIVEFVDVICASSLL